MIERFGDAQQRGKAPLFALSDSERTGVRRFLENGASGAGSPAPAFAAKVSLHRFNCLGCHSRDVMYSLSGIPVTARSTSTRLTVSAEA